MSEVTVDRAGPRAARAARPSLPDWVRRYRMRAAVADLGSASLAGALALFVRFGEVTPYVTPYVLLSLTLPVVWVGAIRINRAYEPRLIGLGAEEFQRIFQCGFTLTAALAIGAYVTKTDVARGYVVLALTALADREHASHIITVLEEAWAAIRTHHPELPRVVMITGQGAGGRC
ncbi:hypothetical protein ACFQ08_22755 [Streptosporangium algeriense]|uniref:Integral membrane protein n=1 Tax=Streptosporangium algeriense TaxID=1682748 RepID=A0ABW3DU57_9ACTN